MGSFVRRMRKRKRCLGEVRMLRREEYQGLELNAKVELIRSLIPLGLMHVQMLLDDEVEALAGPRYAHPRGGGGVGPASHPGRGGLGRARGPTPARRLGGGKTEARPRCEPT